MVCNFGDCVPHKVNIVFDADGGNTILFAYCQYVLVVIKSHRFLKCFMANTTPIHYDYPEPKTLRASGNVSKKTVLYNALMPSVL